MFKNLQVIHLTMKTHINTKSIKTQVYSCTFVPEHSEAPDSTLIKLNPSRFKEAQQPDT